MLCQGLCPGVNAAALRCFQGRERAVPARRAHTDAAAAGKRKLRPAQVPNPHLWAAVCAQKLRESRTRGLSRHTASRAPRTPGLSVLSPGGCPAPPAAPRRRTGNSDGAAGRAGTGPSVAGGRSPGRHQGARGDPWADACAHGGHRTVPLEGARRSAVGGGKEELGRGSRAQRSSCRQKPALRPPPAPGDAPGQATPRVARELAVPPWGVTLGAAASAALGLCIPPGKAAGLWVYGAGPSLPPPSILRCPATREAGEPAQRLLKEKEDTGLGR